MPSVERWQISLSNKLSKSLALQHIRSRIATRRTRKKKQKSKIAANPPIEIIEAIVEHLGSRLDYSGHSPRLDDDHENMESLARMCRVSKAWAAATQPVLWSFLCTPDESIFPYLPVHGHMVKGLRLCLQEADVALLHNVLKHLLKSLPNLAWLHMILDVAVDGSDELDLAGKVIISATQHLPVLDYLILEGNIFAFLPGARRMIRPWANSLWPGKARLLDLPQGLDSYVSSKPHALVAGPVNDIEFLKAPLEYGSFGNLRSLCLDGPWLKGDLEALQGYALDLPELRELWLEQWT